jgi:hypothetical protein
MGRSTLYHQFRVRNVVTNKIDIRAYPYALCLPSFDDGFYKYNRFYWQKVLVENGVDANMRKIIPTFEHLRQFKSKRREQAIKAKLG